MTRWIVLGAGYTGRRVAQALVARGDDVVITRRGRVLAEAAALGVRGVELDLADAGAAAALAALFSYDDIVVTTAPPIDEHGTGEAKLAAAATAAGVRRIIYLSSTGVYAPAFGGWVDEDFLLAPTTNAGRARLAAEQALAAGLTWCVRLRVAGIHGPGRGVIARLRAGTYRLIGDGSTQVSRIHVDDLVACVLAAGDAAAPGQIYNVADDEPCTSWQLATAAAVHLGLPPPPWVPIDGVDAEVAGMLTADRRIDNRRLKRDLGVWLRHPSWRSALTDDAA